MFRRDGIFRGTEGGYYLGDGERGEGREGGIIIWRRGAGTITWREGEEY